MEDSEGALYGDLLRVYGVDLLDCVRDEPTLSPRRVLKLVETLPPDCMTAVRLRDQEDAFGWDNQTYLMATLIDAVRENTFVYMQSQTKKKLKPFEPVKVPGLEERKPKPQENSFVRMAQEQLFRAGKD